MKVLLIGGGGREHALAWKLARSERITGMWCAPGNPGISGERLISNRNTVECVAIGADDLEGLAEFARKNLPDLTIVGPDNPLGMGIVDLFQQQNLPIWGPNRKAAQFESSKVFSQEFLEKHGLPHAEGCSFTDPEQALAFAEQRRWKCVIKVDGLALGKGVFVCSSHEQVQNAIHSIFVENKFGTAGNQIVVQELLEGLEVSLHAICDGERALLFPTSQDHKQVFDGDRGPNTGGMGAFSPAPFLDQEGIEAIHSQIIDPWLKGCRSDGIDFRGILYPGIMITSKGPQILEFNARFGDPETQVYLPKMKNDLLDVIEASMLGKLDQVELNWEKGSTVCVVMASEGYPGSYSKGKVINGLTNLETVPNTMVFHAGTKEIEGKIVTNGGRVLGVTAWADSLNEARDRASDAVESIHFDGAFYRRDIASKAIE